MGLFSSSTTTTVGTTVSRVIEDRLLPNSAKSGVLKGVLGKDGQIVENILEDMLSSVGVRAGRMYAYAKDHYAYGLPSGKLLSAATGESIAQGLVKEMVGATAIMDYYHYGPLNRLHVGWYTLFSQYGYVQDTNILGVLSAQKGYPVYLKDMVSVVTEASLAEMENGSLEQWGSPPTAGYTPERKFQTYWAGILSIPTVFELDPSSTFDYVRVSYVWEELVTVGTGLTAVSHLELREDFFTVSITGFNLESDYFQVKYSMDTQVGYVLYQAGEGTYPEIDAIFATQHTNSGSYFPFTYFRYNKVPEDANKSSEGYKTSKKLVKYLGMDFDAITKAIHENPGIADVEQAMLTLAVPANTTNPLERRYLFDYFSRMYLQAGAVGTGLQLGVDSPQAQAISRALTGAQPAVSMVIQDARFKMALSCQGITKRRKGGTIGAKGSYGSGTDFTTVTRKGNNQETGEQVFWTETTMYHLYQYQVTESLYDEVRVAELRMTYHIFGEYTTVGEGDSKILLIPVDIALTEAYSIPDKETFYSQALHYVFNSRILTKVKWYQSELFQFIMLVVAVVIAVYTGIDTYNGLMALYGTMTTEAFITMIALKLLDSVLISIAIKLFVKAIGPEAAFLIAIVALAAGVYMAVDAGSISGAPWAGKLLAISSNMIKAVGESYNDALNGLINESKSFTELYAEKNRLLEDANKLLEQTNFLSPLVIFGETPDEFFNRTVHSGNIGINSIDAVSNYVEIALTLPKLDETIGVSSNAT